MKQSNAVDAFSALGHDTRLDIYRALVEAGPAGMPASDIAARLDIRPSNLTFHIGLLQRTGLVQSRREGRWIIYSADFSVMADLVDFLTQKCCGGHPEVCMPSRKPKKRAS